MFISQHRSRLFYKDNYDARRVNTMYVYIILNNATRMLCRYNMQNEAGEFVDMYIPRKW